MKVMYDHQIFAIQRFGGVSRYFFELSNQFEGLGASVDYKINSPLYCNDYLRSARSRLKIRGIHVPKITHSSHFYNSVNRILSPLTFRGWHPDIVHETYYSPKSVAPFGARIVLTVYDMIHEKFTNNFSGRDKTSELKKIAVSRANHIICISENTKRDLIEVFNVPEEKISVVYLGFSFKDDNSSVKSLLEKPYILYVGKRGKYKNFERLLKTFSLSPTLIKNFVLVAFGGGKFRPEEQKNIRELGLHEDNITQMSGSDEVLKNLYKNATAFILSFFIRGFWYSTVRSNEFELPCYL